MIIPLSSEKFDLDHYRAMQPLDMMMAMRRDLEFKLPPVGKTVERMKINGHPWERTTWRCEKPGCWFVSTPSTESDLATIMEWHRGDGENMCPTSPRRESLPSGLAEIEKLWREIDDVVECIKAKESYRGLDTAGMNGYVKGLAFSVVMKDKTLWPDIRAVSVQAMKRWKMRHKLIPWESTPTRHENDFSGLGQQGGWKPVGTPPSTTPVKKAAPVRKIVSLSAEQIAAIKAAHASTMFTVQELADMYKASVAQVVEITG